MMSTFMSNKIPLSVIIIFNSSANKGQLKATLASVEKAEEVIKFDAGDSPIADFSQVRNQAANQAKHDYLLFLDSDEILDAQSWHEIKKIVNENQADLVSVIRTDVFLGEQLRGGEAANQRLIRLGKKSAMVFTRPVHEVVEVHESAKVVVSKINLWHHSHRNIGEFLQKVSKYSKIEAELRQESDRTFLLWSMFVYPLAKFGLNYFIRHGYRDGWRGFVYAMMMSLHSLFVRVYGWELLAKKVIR